MRQRNRPDRSGFTLIELIVAFGVGSLIVGVILGGIQLTRAAAARAACQNNLRNMALALQLYADENKAYPPAIRRSNDPFPYLTWQARLLPYLEQEGPWRELEADFKARPQFWQPPRHRGEARTISTFLCPAEPLSIAMVPSARSPVGFTHFLGVSGTSSVAADGILFLNSKTHPTEISDGLSSTIAVGERPPSADLHFGWWYAGVGQTADGSADSVLGVREYITTFRAPTCLGRDEGFRPGRQSNLCDAFHFYSNHRGGANFAFADGSVRFLGYKAGSVLPALATRAGGEVVDFPE